MNTDRQHSAMAAIVRAAFEVRAGVRTVSPMDRVVMRRMGGITFVPGAPAPARIRRVVSCGNFYSVVVEMADGTVQAASVECVHEGGPIRRISMIHSVRGRHLHVVR